MAIKPEREVKEEKRSEWIELYRFDVGKSGQKSLHTSDSRRLSPLPTFLKPPQSTLRQLCSIVSHFGDVDITPLLDWFQSVLSDENDLSEISSRFPLISSQIFYPVSPRASADVLCP